MTPAEVCDHIVCTYRTWEEFIKGPFQSLCKQCHDEKSFMFDIPKMDRLKKTAFKGVDV